MSKGALLSLLKDLGFVVCSESLFESPMHRDMMNMILKVEDEREGWCMQTAYNREWTREIARIQLPDLPTPADVVISAQFSGTSSYATSDNLGVDKPQKVLLLLIISPGTPFGSILDLLTVTYRSLAVLSAQPKKSPASTFDGSPSGFLLDHTVYLLYSNYGFNQGSVFAASSNVFNAVSMVTCCSGTSTSIPLF